MPKQGFKGQWVEICRVGDFVNGADGARITIDDKFLKAAIANFNATDHEPPIVIGHPSADAPAFGWTSELRLEGDRLEARFSETQDEFEKMVERGLFKKRSSSFYTAPPVLKHVGFLGAAAPAVKGLKNIQFAEGESFTLETTINLQETQMKETDLDQLPESFWDKVKSMVGSGEKSESGGSPISQSPATAQFSESSVRDLIAEAVKGVTAEFSEKLEAKDTEIAAIKSIVDAGTVFGRRSEIVSFVEAIPAEKGKHFLKRAGIVDFMESLAVADAGDAKPAISFSEGTGDQKEDHTFSRLDWFKNYVGAQKSFVQFGEQFGDLKATAEAMLDLTNPEELDAFRGGMGVEAKTAGGDK